MSLIAADPFIGAWKLNIAKTGSDVLPGPLPSGRQFKIEDLGQNRYQFTAGDGKTTTLTCTLSADGTTVTYIEHDPDRPVVLRRVGGGTGFPGSWEIPDLLISLWQSDGLTFYYPVSSYMLNIRFDGKNWPGTNGHGTDYVSSGQRLNQNTLEITDREEGKLERRIYRAVSSDGKAMTLTSHETNQSGWSAGRHLHRRLRQEIVPSLQIFDCHKNKQKGHGDLLDRRARFDASTLFAENPVARACVFWLSYSISGK